MSKKDCLSKLSLKYARINAGIVVLGILGGTNLCRFLERQYRTADRPYKCDLLAIKPDGFTCPNTVDSDNE